MDLLRLADDQAQVGRGGGDIALPAAMVPRGRRHGLRDEVDQAVEVGVGPVAGAAGAARGLVGAAGQARGKIGHHRRVDHGAAVRPAVLAGHHRHRRRHRAEAAAAAHRVGHGVVPRAGQSHARAGDEVGNRYHQVAHGVDLLVDVVALLRLAGDVQDFILDDVAEMVLFEDQVQAALQLDVAGQFQSDGRVRGKPFHPQPLVVEVDVDVDELGQLVEHLAQGPVVAGVVDGRLELLLDLQFLFAAMAAIQLHGGRGPPAGDRLPVLEIGEDVGLVRRAGC